MTEPWELSEAELADLRGQASRGRMLTLQERLAHRLPGRRPPPRPDADPLPVEPEGGHRGPLTEGAPA